MTRRTNIKIIRNQNTPEVRLEPFENEDDNFDILCRNLHTLVGICGSQDSLIPMQFDYSSIAIIEEVACSYAHLFEIGDKVIMTPHLEKYIGIRDLKKEQRTIYQKGRPQIDDVAHLFFPLICRALAIRDEIEDYQNVLFLGCNLTGAVLLKLLSERNISSVICLDEMDVSEKLLYENGAGKVNPFIQNSLPEGIDECGAIVLNSYPKHMVDEIRKRDSSIPVIKGERWSKEHEGIAFDILQQQSIRFEDIISHHDHAENISVLAEEMKVNKYKGKAIIFDW